MPEGPSIVILKEAVMRFKGKTVLAVSGNSRMDIKRMERKRVDDFKSWGKHFLICFDNFYVKIHFMLFGSYLIDETKAKPPRLTLVFDNGQINFYACSVQIMEGDPDEVYDYSADVLSPSWDGKKARKKLKEHPEMIVADALLDQNVFSGVGNIIKNEVLFRTHIHPQTKIKDLPPAKLSELIKEAVNYSYDFLRWKKEFVLKKHWLAHTKKVCPRCNLPLIKRHLGKTNRRTFYCENCQKNYSDHS